MSITMKFSRRAFSASLLLPSGFLMAANHAATRFKLMSFNMWVGGTASGSTPTDLANAVKTAGADVVGMQETDGNGEDVSKEVAKLLGWNHLQQGGRTAVISRFRIVDATPRKWGVFLEIKPETRICVFNCHFAPAPYQPYQLLDIPYGNAPFIKTEQEAIEWAVKSRGAQVQRMRGALDEVRKQAVPIFVTGDFNEPSHLDWTHAAAKAGLHPIKVEYPTTKTIMEHGLVDAFREQHPASVRRPGFTWTRLTEVDDPKDHHDRIDFVLADQERSKVLDCKVVGESKSKADLVLNPWPSDHRAVVATIKLR